jgi:hypothetical protein
MLENTSQGGYLTITSDKMIKAEAGKIYEIETLVEVEASNVCLFKMDAIPNIKRLLRKVCLCSSEHMRGIVDSPDLNAGSGELNGEAGSANTQFKCFIAALVGKVDIEVRVLLFTEKIVVFLCSFAVCHLITSPASDCSGTFEESAIKQLPRFSRRILSARVRRPRPPSR